MRRSHRDGWPRTRWPPLRAPAAEGPWGRRSTAPRRPGARPIAAARAAGSPGANPARLHGAKLSVVQAADIFDALERLLAHTKKKVQLAGEAQLESLHGWTLEAKMRKNDMKTVDSVYPTGHRGLKMASREKMKQAMNYDPTSGRRIVRGDRPPRRKLRRTRLGTLNVLHQQRHLKSACVRVRRDKNVSYKTATTTTTAA